MYIGRWLAITLLLVIIDNESHTPIINIWQMNRQPLDPMVFHPGAAPQRRGHLQGHQRRAQQADQLTQQESQPIRPARRPGGLRLRVVWEPEDVCARILSCTSVLDYQVTSSHRLIWHACMHACMMNEYLHATIILSYCVYLPPIIDVWVLCVAVLYWITMFDQPHLVSQSVIEYIH